LRLAVDGARVAALSSEPRDPLRERGSAIAALRVKRAFDVAFAAAGLIVSSPVWLLLALAVKLEDRGPVFFRQQRSGLNGRVFEVLKFRSMHVDAERLGARQAVANDARITRVGRWMRRTAMDELPQLWNILIGDMSVVGPRALRPGEIEAHGAGIMERLEDVPGFAVRSSVRPGLTGVAQIYAGRNLPRRQKFRYDRLYIRRQSHGLDLRLVMLSFWISFSGTWEARGESRM
jgi:lipopolysaccharide/colanic/teichoic acid biosynthesis glycosyltransferase